MTEEARIRLSLETSEARRQIGRFREEFKEAQQDAQGMIGSMSGALGGAFAGAAAGLAGGAAAGFAGLSQSLRSGPAGGGLSGALLGNADTALSAGIGIAGAGVGAAVTAASGGNLLLGRLAQQATEAGLDLGAAPIRDRIKQVQAATAAGIAEVQQRFGPGAIRGGQIDEEVLARALEAAIKRAMNTQVFNSNVQGKGSDIGLRIFTTGE